VVPDAPRYDVKSLFARAQVTVKRLAPHVRMAATIASELAGHLPGKDSTRLQKIVGSISAADKVYGVIKGGRDPIVEYVQRHQLVSERSEPFVSLFFDSDMADNFDTKKVDLTKYQEGVEALGSSGRLFFTMSTSGEGKPHSTFYRSKTFDVQAAVDAVWEARNGRLGAEVMALEWGDSKTSYYTYPESIAEMFGEAPKTLKWLIDRHRRFQVDGIPRSYCLFGPPGTGKTSFADRFASQLGHRTLRVDAGGFMTLTSRDLGFLVGILKPDFLIVDDADKAGAGPAVSRLLALLERFKHEHPKTTFMMTANTTTGFDTGFLRPERIDEWIRFEMPKKPERLAIIESYLKDSKLRPSEHDIELMAEATDGLSQDYLREFAQLAERVPMEEVVSSIKMRQELLKASQMAGPGGVPGGAPGVVAKASFQDWALKETT
jgi:hypothetical protein